MIDIAAQSAGRSRRRRCRRAAIGTRIRERRRALGLTQAELARRVGISASYMNLIERNRRAIAGPLLRRTAEALTLRLEELDGAAERRLLERLDEIAHAPELAALGIEAEPRRPIWSPAIPAGRARIAALARSEREASAAARALADRLTHDPFLGETVHRMLTRIATIRSAGRDPARQCPRSPADQRTRFHRMIHEESRALSEVGEALAAYFDRIDAPRRTLTPLDEVEALFDARGNHIPELEAAACELSEPDRRSRPRGATGRRRAGSSKIALGPAIDAILDAQREVETAPGRSRARQALVGLWRGRPPAADCAALRREPRRLAMTSRRWPMPSRWASRRCAIG